jgi:SAM-dependent methyltransferase
MNCRVDLNKHRNYLFNEWQEYRNIEQWDRAMSVNQKTPPEFDEYAHSYNELLDDSLRRRFTQDPLYFHKRKCLLLEALLRSEGRDPSTMKWLDVGCGQGELLELAGKNFGEAVGCDPSAGMLAARSSFSMHKQLSPIALPFADKSIDFVTAVCVYHHVHGTDRIDLTHEIARVLKPGGLCCVIEHNPWNPVTRRIVKRCAVDVDAELLTARQANSIFRTSGFKILDTAYFLYFPEWLFDRCGALEAALGKVPLGGQYALLAKAPF